ncbi:hypothetical protein GCM10025868_10760 [Angustibacter aerolatus]|uniref:Peroxiredoxin n=1 Tax=Angustibacter aerolatus TaxID=1162965 RepID=A0ABQ6JCB3_9ACTN|nr:OsmC family protein [Angustibacter aerolatus]GMA85826.1 hypothetical protein GCM10025868_10760 [Angustibacter aerolatus]
MTADAPFGGDPAYPNPEQLLLAAAASCRLLSFLALAARAHVDVLEYADDAEAEMPVGRERMRITRIVLRPRVRVGDGTDRALVTRLLHEAHEECYVARLAHHRGRDRAGGHVLMSVYGSVKWDSARA